VEQLVSALDVIHGQEVSKAVHEARETTEPGPERGKAVSLAACLAAHDRSTLPMGAQNAPGQEGKEPKDCEKTGGEPSVNTLDVSHGQEVSNAVHEAKESTEPGPERGKAVSQAACLAAHDRATLPDGAQNAPGQVGKDPKDCDKTDGTAAEQDKVPPGQAKKDESVSAGAGEEDETEAGEVCGSNQERSTLPGKAQTAPGQTNRELKPCPSADEALESGDNTDSDKEKGKPASQPKGKPSGPPNR
jgi:hypothetical protein